jgi:hypothetical protein
MSRIVRAQSVHAACTYATTAIIIFGRWRGRRRWSTAWCAVRSPRARVGGTPSAPQPHGPSVCRAGVWAGTCCAGSVIVVLLAIGRCLSCVWRDRTPTRSGCPMMPSSIILANIKRGWQPGNKTLPSSGRATGIARRWCGRSTASNRQKGMKRCRWCVSGCASGCGGLSPCGQGRRRRCAG